MGIRWGYEDICVEVMAVDVYRWLYGGDMWRIRQWTYGDGYMEGICGGYGNGQMAMSIWRGYVEDTFRPRKPTEQIFQFKKDADAGKLKHTQKT
jgi:hypothetical protein